MKKKPALSIRAEIREVIDRGERLGVPLTSELLWGSIAREVPKRSFLSEVSQLVTRNEALMARPPEGVFDRQCFVYKPGPVPVPQNDSRPQAHRSMGFMERRRLMDARAKARRVWRDAEKRAA